MASFVIGTEGDSDHVSSAGGPAPLHWGDLREVHRRQARGQAHVYAQDESGRPVPDEPERQEGAGRTNRPRRRSSGALRRVQRAPNTPPQTLSQALAMRPFRRPHVSAEVRRGVMEGQGDMEAGGQTECPGEEAPREGSDGDAADGEAPVPVQPLRPQHCPPPRVRLCILIIRSSSKSQESKGKGDR